ncbi:hypothetical protein E2C01_002597 [Portunus trituberculatus]|uniref:Uncharacterized protein n=1 Tax=Portunus trituberculatus TaxID=210409 RepID=A0A5B7CL66_PORTR|nr:hypothetical protein [Portunus trituberculatus]
MGTAGRWNSQIGDHEKKVVRKIQQVLYVVRAEWGAQLIQIMNVQRRWLHYFIWNLKKKKFGAGGNCLLPEQPLQLDPAPSPLLAQGTLPQLLYAIAISSNDVLLRVQLCVACVTTYAKARNVMVKDVRNPQTKRWATHYTSCRGTLAFGKIICRKHVESVINVVWVH